MVPNSTSRLQSRHTHPEAKLGEWPTEKSATRKDARGITTTYSYDALNRITQKVYTDGTPTVTFTYDTPIPDGPPATNTVGHLVEAFSPAMRPPLRATIRWGERSRNGRARR